MGSVECCQSRPSIPATAESLKISVRKSVHSPVSTQASLFLLESPKSVTGKDVEISDEEFILRNIKRTSIEELLSNLPSCVPVSVTLKENSWVTPPKCVGALSALRLAEVLAGLGENNHHTTQAIGEGLGIEKVLINLGSVHRDKRESAAIALEQISILREPIFMSKLISDRSLLVLAIRLTEDVEEFRSCMSNVIYNLFKGNTRVKLRIADFQSGRILRAMVGILPEFTEIDAMYAHAGRLREFYLDRSDSPDAHLLSLTKQFNIQATIRETLLILANVDDGLNFENVGRLKSLLRLIQSETEE